MEGALTASLEEICVGLGARYEAKQLTPHHVDIPQAISAQGWGLM